MDVLIDNEHVILNYLSSSDDIEMDSEGLESCSGILEGFIEPECLREIINGFKVVEDGTVFDNNLLYSLRKWSKKELRRVRKESLEKLEKDGKGLNLTWEVRDGILNHQTRLMPHTLEGKIVRLSDKIAYINHDIDDAIRAQILTEENIPLELRKTLGFSTRQRLNTLIHNIISNSVGKDDIIMSEEVEQAMIELRKFMFDHVYKNPVAKGEETKAKAMIEQLFFYYMEHIELLPEKYLRMRDAGETDQRIICDYISGMTDQYAITKFSEYFMPQAWQVDGY